MSQQLAVYAQDLSEHSKVREWETFAHIFGFISAHCGILPFLSGQGHHRICQGLHLPDATVSDAVCDTEKRGQVILETVFGKSRKGRAIRARVVAIDIAASLRRTVNDPAAYSFSVNVCLKQLRRLRLCFEEGGRSVGGDTETKIRLITVEIRRALATLLLTNLRTVQHQKCAAELLRAARQRASTTDALPVSVSSLVRQAGEEVAAGLVRRGRLRETILQRQTEYSESAFLMNLKTLVERLELRDTWVHDMQLLDSGLSTGAVVLTKGDSDERHLTNKKRRFVELRDLFFLEAESKKTDERDGEPTPLLKRRRSRKMQITARSSRVPSLRQLLSQNFYVPGTEEGAHEDRSRGCASAQAENRRCIWKSILRDALSSNGGRANDHNEAQTVASVQARGRERFTLPWKTSNEV